MSAALSTRPQIDIGRTLDEGAFSTFQKIIVILAALSIVLDGFDGQMIGFAIPVIMKESVSYTHLTLPTILLV